MDSLLSGPPGKPRTQMPKHGFGLMNRPWTHFRGPAVRVWELTGTEEPEDHSWVSGRTQTPRISEDELEMRPSRWNPCCVSWSQRWEHDLAMKMLICISLRAVGPAYRTWRRVVLYTLVREQEERIFFLQYGLQYGYYSNFLSHFCKRKCKLGNKEEHTQYGY